MHNLHITLSIFFDVILFLPLSYVAGELSRYVLIDMAKGMVSIDSEGSKVSFLIVTTTTSQQNEHNFHPNPSNFFKVLSNKDIFPNAQ